MSRRAHHLSAFACLAVMMYIGIAGNPGPSAARPSVAEVTARSAVRAQPPADSMLAAAGATGSDLLRDASIADSLGRLAYALQDPHSLSLAEQLFTRALRWRESMLGSRHMDVAYGLTRLATVEEALGRWTDAYAHEQRSLAIRIEKGQPGPIASSRIRLGQLAYRLAHFAAADSALDLAIATYDSLGDSTRVCDALNPLGESARAQDDLGRAAAYFGRALDIARGRAAVRRSLFHALLNNLAGVYKDQGRYADAEPLLVESLDLRRAESVPDTGAIATAELNLAEVYRLQSRTEEAAPLYNRALTHAIAAMPPGHPELATFLNQYAVFCWETGNVRDAQRRSKEALAVIERALGSAHPAVAQSLHDLAVHLSDAGRHAEAFEAFRRALEIREASLGGDHPDACQTRVAWAQAMWRSPGPADSAARALLDPVFAALDATPSQPRARLDAYALRAEIHARAGRLGDAIADMSVALDQLDSMRTFRGGGDEARARLVAENSACFDHLIEWQLAGGDTAGAWMTHERGRARVLLDQVMAAGVDLRHRIAPMDAGGLGEMERGARMRLALGQRRLEEALGATDQSPGLARRVAALAAVRDSAARDLRRARQAIRERSPVWRDVVRTGGPALDPDQIRDAVVPEAGYLIAFHLGRERSVMFLVPRPGEAIAAYDLEATRADAAVLRIAPGHVRAGTLDSLLWGESGDQAGSEGSRAIKSPWTSLRRRVFRSETERQLHSMWRVLFPQQAWNRIRKASEVVIIPDGPIHALPFDALVVRPRTDKLEMGYWLDVGPPIRLAASAASLAGVARRTRKRATARTESSALSVSNPTFDPSAPERWSGTGRRDSTRGSTWGPLPATERESREVKLALLPESTVVIQGEAATEPAVRAAMAGKRYLHFATHGFVIPQGGNLLGGLVLTPPRLPTADTDADGLLQLFEIYELSLDCDLAVLSACETEAGPWQKAEGAAVLSRAFVAAGCQRTVSTLWAVDDVSTSALIGTFFRRASENRRLGQPSYARALRDAKRAIRKRDLWGEPLHWAGFVLSGLP